MTDQAARPVRRRSARRAAPRHCPRRRGRPAPPSRRRGGRRTSGPTSCWSLMDDFSMDLLQHDAAAPGRCATRGASYPHSFVVDSLCCVSRASTLHRAVPPPDRRAAPTPPTPPNAGRTRVGGWAAFVEPTATEARSVAGAAAASAATPPASSASTSTSTSTARDGSAPPAPPGWDDWRRACSARPTTAGTSRAPGSSTGGLAGRHHPRAAALGAATPRRTRAYAGTVIERDGPRLHPRATRDDEAPYFLEVAPYAPHSRIHAAPALPRRPAVPAGVPRPARAAGSRTATAGRSAATGSASRDLPGYGDDQARQPPRAGPTATARAVEWRTGRAAGRRRRPCSDLRNRARMVQSVDRMRAADPRRQVGPDTYVVLTSDNGFHLGQHGLGARQGHAVRHRRAGARCWSSGPACVPGAAQRAGHQHRPGADVRGPRRPRVAARYRSGPVAGADASRTRPWRRERDYVFFEHTWAPSLGPTTRTGVTGGALDVIPSYVAVRSRTRLLVRFDLDPDCAAQRHGLGVLRSYAEQGFETRQPTTRHRGTADAGGASLTRKIEQLGRRAPRSSGVTPFRDGLSLADAPHPRGDAVDSRPEP